MKKLLSMSLALILCLSLVTPVVAAKEGGFLDAEVQNKILQVLAATEPEKESYGLGNADYEAISIGNDIPAYRVEDGALVSAGLRILPVIVEGELVNLLYIVQKPGEEPFVQLSSGLVAPIKQVLTANDPIAIVYDDEGVHIFCNEAVSCLKEAERQESEEKKNLVSAVPSQEFARITANRVQTKLNLNVEAYWETLTATRASNPACYLPVEIIQQPEGTNVCWAITCAAIINYVKGTNYTYSQVAAKIKNYLTTNDTFDVISSMNAAYHMGYGARNGNSIDENVALAQLIAGYPLYGGFAVYTGFTPGPQEPSGGGHAVVVRGINTVTNAFSVMNPTANVTTYTMGSYSDGAWQFVNEDDGRIWQLRQYGLHE